MPKKTRFFWYFLPLSSQAVPLHPTKMLVFLLVSYVNETGNTNMALSAMAIMNAKPRSKPYKLSGGGGLYLPGLFNALNLR
jgi:hypothetical protein